MPICIFGPTKEFSNLCLGLAEVCLHVLRYGFHKDRGKEALQVCDGDLGLALEYLLAECFNLNNTDSSATEDDINDITEQRNEEMMALQAIYDDRFIERIPSKVWILKLNLPHLDELIQPVNDHKPKFVDDDDRQICRFYLRGFCKFGRRCRMKHAKPDESHRETETVDSVKEKTDASDFEHEVEVRFPSGNLYPREPPFIAFTSTSRIEKHICLNITKHMIAEAKSLAESQEPSIFTVISLLDDDSFLDNVVTEPPGEFSCPHSNRPWIHSSGQLATSVTMFHHKDVIHDTDDNDNDKDTDHKLAKATESMVRMTERHADKRESSDREKIEIKRSSSRDDSYSKKINPAEILKTNKKLIDDFKRKQVESTY